MEYISIITGATSGIGYELCKLIAKDNTDILIISSNEQRLIKTKKEIELISKNKVDYLVIDFSINDIKKYDEIRDRIKDKKIKFIINNAGFGDFGKFSNCNIEKQNSMINVNILALTNISKIFLENTKNIKYDAYLLNVASVASFMSGPLMSVYYATKAYVLSFTEAISYENRKNKFIHISALCPGPTNTNFIKSSNLENSNLFNNLKSMSAKEVAKISYKGLLKNKKIIIPGILNKIMVFLVKISPRKLTIFFTNLIMKNK